jgi:hypothetical protein
MAAQSTNEQYAPLTREELDSITGEPLPERAALSLVNANLAIPINAALGLNVLSDHSVASGTAFQATPVNQSGSDTLIPPPGDDK